MSKTAFVFPGQGAQKAGMGKDFYEHSEIAEYLYEKAEDLLDIDMKALCFEENEKLDITEYTQAAMVTTCLAMARVLEAKGIRPDVCAGLSLGEYCAIAMAGGMSDADAIKAVRKRGILMQEAMPEGKGAMAAVLGVDGKDIEAQIKGIENVSVANFNCPGQIVITGLKEAVEEAKEVLSENGAKRVLMLNVSGAFHSPLLKEAGEKLGAVLEEVSWGHLKIPYVTNVTAEYVCTNGPVKELLEHQVASPVRWQESVERMIAEGVDTFVEIGPGKTLSGFIRKINKNVKIYSVGTWDDAEKLAEEWKSR